MGSTALSPRREVSPHITCVTGEISSPVPPADGIDIVSAALQSLDTTSMGIDRIFRGVGAARGITDVVTSYVTIRRARKE